MAREVLILDGAELVPAADYYARKAARTAHLRTGSPTIISDWAEPVYAPVGDGYRLTSRADQRAMMAREGVRECGDAGYLESARAPEYRPTPGKRKVMHDLLNGNRPVPEAVRANLEGRTAAPPMFNREALCP